MLCKLAESSQLLASTVGQSVWVTLVGVVAGLVISTGLTRYLAGFLIGVTAEDPATLLCASAAMLMCGIAAAYLPAQRAMRVDPIQALKFE